MVCLWWVNVAQVADDPKWCYHRARYPNGCQNQHSNCLPNRPHQNATANPPIAVLWTANRTYYPANPLPCVLFSSNRTTAKITSCRAFQKAFLGHQSINNFSLNDFHFYEFCHFDWINLRRENWNDERIVKKTIKTIRRMYQFRFELFCLHLFPVFGFTVYRYSCNFFYLDFWQYKQCYLTTLGTTFDIFFLNANGVSTSRLFISKTSDEIFKF